MADRRFQVASLLIAMIFSFFQEAHLTLLRRHFDCLKRAGTRYYKASQLASCGQNEDIENDSVEARQDLTVLYKTRTNFSVVGQFCREESNGGRI